MLQSVPKKVVETPHFQPQGPPLHSPFADLFRKQMVLRRSHSGEIRGGSLFGCTPCELFRLEARELPLAEQPEYKGLESSTKRSGKGLNLAALKHPHVAGVSISVHTCSWFNTWVIGTG